MHWCTIFPDIRLVTGSIGFPESPLVCLQWRLASRLALQTIACMQSAVLTLQCGAILPNVNHKSKP